MLNTTDEVKARFEAEGLSIREWAAKRGYKWRIVYAVLNGEVKCRRGTSHKIAVELGLKAEPKVLKLRETVDTA
jgi:gp16 family phage-associated protein